MRNYVHAYISDYRNRFFASFFLSGPTNYILVILTDTTEIKKKRYRTTIVESSYRRTGCFQAGSARHRIHSIQA